MLQKCREIAALSPAECARRDEIAMDDPFLGNQGWTARMIPYFMALRDKYRHAADHPRDLLPPDPPQPD